MVLGGSTNAVLHLIAMAHSVGIRLTLDEIQAVSDRTPFLADLKPSGKYVMEDVHKMGGIPSTSQGIQSSYPSDMEMTHRDSRLSSEAWPHQWQ
jgi:dihydroxy-acid dehydratase